ncbi:sulfatase [Hyphomicrobium denitrificans 1NES1]|uniref:Sulfatase n=1 Tax=Hyphomicrobium denitrificans 1NES1 TaxID=670307 RepID=N0B877_9HYPH|nr:phosphoethanolamine--lipid A transferase [Hyphomicrobium denitrificans]AGK56265.1 sulfatase [Hyphomicrobium denitrificans 1NES1]
MFKPRRPEILILVLAIYIALVLNYPFWHKLFTAAAPQNFSDWHFLAAIVIAVILVLYLILLAISLKPVLRVVVLIFLPVTAAASYFMSEYGIVIDTNMVRNVFETDTREAGDLMSLKLAAYVGILGLLPAILFCVVPWTPQTFKNEALAKMKYAAVAAPLLVLALFPVWGSFLSLFREQRDLKMTLTPFNYIVAVSSYWQKQNMKQAKSVAPYGEDAHRVSDAQSRTRKSLFVVVVGETARWDHFALNGYVKPTNPELSKIKDLINYSQAYSCGTDTAQSVPCMFSGLSKAGFTNAKAASRENLLDILKRAGIDVLWRENQAGCKGVCDRVPTETLTGHKVPTFYPSTENFDDVLVDGLDQRIATMQRDTVIVLHMMGSHGPAYWKRYPEKFEIFKPACKVVQFSDCETADIINAYDNTIVYTDHVLARLIGVLSTAENHGVDAGMLYVSDHGESLGEHNMYLHGMPYAFAPEAQIHVPMVVWLSPSMREAAGIDQSCLDKRASQRVSHDNLFPSVLGLMDVKTRVYDPGLDLFAACRKPAS